MSDYKDDNVWLMKGDCLERMKEIPKGSVDLVLTDPPFSTTSCKWDKVVPFESMWDNIWRTLKIDGACALFGTDQLRSMLKVSNLEDYKYDWIWVREWQNTPERQFQ